MQQVLTLLTVFSDVCEFLRRSVLLLIHTCNLLRDCDDHYVQEWFVHPFLPPANEVWGKVMFSQVFVCSQEGLTSKYA